MITADHPLIQLLVLIDMVGMDADADLVKRGGPKFYSEKTMFKVYVVSLYGMGESVAIIQKLVGCGPVSPAQWAIEYRRGGLDALKSRWAVGNARKLSEEQRQELCEKLEQYSPEQVIAPDVRVEGGSFWTISDLEIVVEQWYGGDVSQSNLLPQLASCQWLELSEGRKGVPFSTGSGAVSRL